MFRLAHNVLLNNDLAGLPDFNQHRSEQLRRYMRKVTPAQDFQGEAARQRFSAMMLSDIVHYRSFEMFEYVGAQQLTANLYN